MSSGLQEKAQSLCDAATADVNAANALAGVNFFAADRSGKTLCHVAAGVRQMGEPDKIDKDDTHFWIASCTKLVTAIACMQLVEQGKIDLDDDASKYATYLKDATMMDGSKPKKMPTIRQCLTHTTGQGYPFFDESINSWFKKQGIREFSCTKASISAPWVSEPGTEWLYGTSLDAAGQVVENVSGQTLDDYFKENIFKPLGIKSMTCLPQKGNLMGRLAGMHQRGTDGKLSPHAPWMEQEDAKIEVQYGGAALYANAREYVQILVALLNSGTHPAGGQILKKASCDELFRPQLSPSHVKDLERTLYAVTEPQMSNPVTGCAIPGVPKQWSFGGLLTPEGLPPFGRSGKSAWWAGIANHYWWIDMGDGTCGMFQAQLGPFGDPAAVGLWAQLEVETHNAVKSE